MLKRIAVWAVVAVALVLAAQVLLREGPPRSLFVPPSLKLPAAVDDLTERASRQQAQPAAPEDDARRRGVTFRARGNEPSWLLEISYERIGIALELGVRRIEFPHRGSTVSGARTAYRTFSGTQELNVVVDQVPCNDKMSGERFESTVTVTFEHRTYYGCGQPL
jgi:uncharacterized membrane protein